jgi:hypothetical protein
MWYPNSQQQPRWQGYAHHPTPAAQNYSRTTYYSNRDELSTTTILPTYQVPINDENDSSVPYHHTAIHEGIYGATPDCYVNPTTTDGAYYVDEMSTVSLPIQTTTNTYCNPVIAAPAKASIVIKTTNVPATSTSSSSSACWDWRLYSPQFYSHFYTPSSTYVVQNHCHVDDDFDSPPSLPTWLLALLYPSPKIIRSSDDENDTDQEIHSLNTNDDEPSSPIGIDNKISHGSSNFLSTDSNPNHNNHLNVRCSSTSVNVDWQQAQQQHRSSTPDTDDGYQSATDASRSDYSQQSSSSTSSLHYDHRTTSKEDMTIHSGQPSVPSSHLQPPPTPTPLMPGRISYAAAAKPMATTSSTNKVTASSPLSKTPSLTAVVGKTKPTTTTTSTSPTGTTNDSLNGSQKPKFIAPRFERMHHAKQYSTTASIKDMSTARMGTRSTNQRTNSVNSARRR